MPNKELIDKMRICRTMIRHVQSCNKCLHYKECLEKGFVASSKGRYIAHVAIDLLPKINAALAYEYGKRGLPSVSIHCATMPDFDAGYIAVLKVSCQFRNQKRFFRKPLTGCEGFEELFAYVDHVFTFVKRKELRK